MHRILLSLGLLTAMGTATWAQGPRTCRIPCRLPAPRAVSETPPQTVDPEAIEHTEVYNGPAYETQRPVHQRILTCGLQVWNENGEVLDAEAVETPPCAGRPSMEDPTVLTYNFEAGTLEEIAGIGPVLRQLANTEELGSDFQTQHGRCGESFTHLAFAQNAGLSFDNSAANGFLAGTYSIEIKFRFYETESWRRILDFNNQGEDMGIYLKNGLLEYYGPATGQYANMPAVQPGQWVHVLFIRREAKDGNWVMEMFANGQHVLTTPAPEESHLDASGQVVFFQDDQQVMNEASAGNVSFIRLYNYALNAQQVPEALAQTPLRPEDITPYSCAAEGYDIDGEATVYDKPYHIEEGISQGETLQMPYSLEPTPVQLEQAIEPQLPETPVCQCLPLEFIEEAPAVEVIEPVEPVTEIQTPGVEAQPGTPAETDAPWVFYPNPATEGIWVRGITPDAPVQATLLDAAGRTVPGLAVAAPNGNTVYIAWPAGTASGQYILTVHQGATAHTQRVVVQ